MSSNDLRWFLKKCYKWEGGNSFTNLLFDLPNSLDNSSLLESLQQVWEVSFEKLLLQHIPFPFHRFGWGGAGVDGGAEVDDKGNPEDSLDKENITS